MEPVGLGNPRGLTDYARNSPRTPDGGRFGALNLAHAGPRRSASTGARKRAEGGRAGRPTPM